MRPHEWPTRRRIALTLLIFGGVLAYGTGSAVVAHERAALEFDVELVQYHVNDTLNAVDRATLRVTSHEPAPVTVAVSTWTQARKAQHHWRVVTGPTTIRPGQTATLVIAAKGFHGRLELGIPAQVTLKTADGSRRVAITFTPTNE